jgi:hypothetical protein
LMYQYRATTGGSIGALGSQAIDAAALNVPIRLRFTRKGNVVTPEYSTNSGGSFHPAGGPIQFGNPPLPRQFYAGLCLSAHDPQETVRAHFSSVDIKKL